MRELEAKTSFVYGTRRLQAGDYFTAQTAGDACVLVALGKAGHHTGDGKGPSEKPKKPQPQTSIEGLKKLRADYQEVLKKKPFGGWDAVELQRRIDEALQ